MIGGLDGRRANLARGPQDCRGCAEFYADRTGGLPEMGTLLPSRIYQGLRSVSVLVSAAETETPGVLLHLLAPLSKRGISMTRIESRPSRKRKWDYVFFLDLDGHADDESVRKALDEMKAQASLFKVLGSFPKAIL